MPGTLLRIEVYFHTADRAALAGARVLFGRRMKRGKSLNEGAIRNPCYRPSHQGLLKYRSASAFGMYWWGMSRYLIMSPICTTEADRLRLIAAGRNALSCASGTSAQPCDPCAS